MSLDTLSEFLDAIDAIGELRRISAPGGGPALLFEHPVLPDGTRCPYPVAINLYGSMKRMALSLDVAALDEHGARITTLLDLKVPEGLMGKLS